MGNLSKLFTPYYGEGFIKEFKIRFAGMVFLNDVLTLKADLVDEKDMELIFNVTAVNQNNKETVRGTVRFVRYE